MSSRLEGVAALTAQLTELGAKLAVRELRGTVKEALQPALHSARSRVPVGKEAHRTYKGRIVSPGFALASLDIDAQLNKRTGSMEARLGYRQEAFYAAIFLELGTAKMAAQPTLGPALEETEDEALTIIATELRRRVDRITKKGRR